MAGRNQTAGSGVQPVSTEPYSDIDQSSPMTVVVVDTPNGTETLVSFIWFSDQ